MGRIIRASFTLIIALIVILLLMSLPYWEASGSQTNGIAFSAYPPPTTNPSPYPPPGAGFVSPTNTPYSKSLVSVSFSTIVLGLEDGIYASIKLIPGTEATQNIVKELNLNFDSTAITKDSTSTLDYKVPEGSYILQIDAPLSYFREPKGYYIRISEKGLKLNQPLKQFSFRLIPPDKQDLPPCQVTSLPTASSVDRSTTQNSENSYVICRAEKVIDLVGPFVNSEQTDEPKIETENTSGYQYAGPKTTTNNYGVWGRSYVVDPSVFHNNDQYPFQFWAQRVYADNGTNTIETGWDEVSWKDSKQYVYVEGTDMLTPGQRYREWFDFGLAVGSSVEVKIYYEPSLSKWKAMLNLGGGWAILKEVNPGFTWADNGFNRAEGYTDTGVYPAVLPSLFDTGYLCLDSPCNNWYSWNNDFAATTTYADDRTPYYCDMLTYFYRFVVHSHLTYPPIIRK